jgi:hypothetical protein
MLTDPDSSVTYRKFKKNVLEQIEDADVLEDEMYTSALFYIDRDGDSEVVTVEEIAEELEIDDDVSLAEVIEEVMPEELAKRNARYFALVFPGEHDADDTPIVAVVLGALFHAEFLYSEINVEAGMCHLTGWEKDNPLDYPEITVPYRRSIVYQG